MRINKGLKGYRLKINYDSLEEETIKFNELLSKNPQKGIPYKEEEYKISEVKHSYYKLFSWITGEDNDRLVTSQFLEGELAYYGYTVQLYYDIVCLGLTDINNRPKCRICNNPVKFRKIYTGYEKTCSRDCENKISSMNGKLPKSKECREKLSKYRIGRKMPEEIRQKLSKSRKGMKRNISDKTRDRWASLLMNRINENGPYLSKCKKGWYESSVFNKKFYYDSSWELKFIVMCENLYKKSHIKDLSRYYVTNNEYIYYKSTDGILHRYFPDFIITLNDGTTVVIELKPAGLLKKDEVVKLKKMAALKFFMKKKIKYIILTENELFKNIHGSFNIFDYLVLY